MTILRETQNKKKTNHVVIFVNITQAHKKVYRTVDETGVFL